MNYLKNLNRMNKQKIAILLIALLGMLSCNNPWDEHVKVNDDVLDESIGDYLAANSQFTSFVALLKETGVDAILSSSVIYTVYAPTNEALNAVDASLIDTPEKKKFFVQNHIAFGSFSMKDGSINERINMKSNKKLLLNSSDGFIDEISLNPEKEVLVQNGIIEEIGTALIPRYSIWEHLELEAENNKFVAFINSLTTAVFQPELSEQIGLTAGGKPIYDSVFVIENEFLNEFVDLSNEEFELTLLIPSDELLNSEFTKFEQYYRFDDKRSNEVPSAKDTVNILKMIARDMVIDGTFSASASEDTLLSIAGVKIPFNTSSITGSYQTSNGYVHYLTDCEVGIKDKILPIFMEAEFSVFSTQMNSGDPAPYYRLRENASNGMDYICDNFARGDVLGGVVFRGPKVASMKYRFKIRAINDFRKSYRNPSSSTTLIQKLGTVSTSTNAETGEITISEVTNGLKIDSLATFSGDTIFVTKNEYLPLDSMIYDEIDCGYYEFNKSNNVFMRLLSLESYMAVTADYFKLEPVFEEE